MGLDLIELFMVVEKEFQIVLSDAEVSEVDTVGKLVDLVHSRLRQTAQEPCPSQHGFYVVRQALMNTLHVPRSAITPDARLEDLIARTNRRRLWKTFLQSLLEEPQTGGDLVRPQWLSGFIFIVLPVGAIFFFAKWMPFALACVSAAFTTLVAARATILFKTKFPRDLSRVKDLIKFVKALDSNVWSHADVFKKIRDITVEKLEVKPEQVTLQAHWVNDLGAG